MENWTQEKAIAFECAREVRVGFAFFDAFYIPLKQDFKLTVELLAGNFSVY